MYVVDPSDWSCTCPDHHRRGANCKPALTCWALSRASARPILPAYTPSLTREILAVAEGSGPYEMHGSGVATAS